jgi:hypothetical protein
MGTAKSTACPPSQPGLACLPACLTPQAPACPDPPPAYRCSTDDASGCAVREGVRCQSKGRPMHGRWYSLPACARGGGSAPAALATAAACAPPPPLAAPERASTARQCSRPAGAAATTSPPAHLPAPALLVLGQQLPHPAAVAHQPVDQRQAHYSRHDGAHLVAAGMLGGRPLALGWVRGCQARRRPNAPVTRVPPAPWQPQGASSA